MSPHLPTTRSGSAKGKKGITTPRGLQTPKASELQKKGSFFDDDDNEYNVTLSPPPPRGKPPTTPKMKTPREVGCGGTNNNNRVKTSIVEEEEQLSNNKNEKYHDNIMNEGETQVNKNNDAPTAASDAVPPPTPISKVLQEAINFLKTPRGRHILVNSVEYDSDKLFFFSNTDNHHQDADNYDEDSNVYYGKTDEEYEHELKLAKELAVALDRFLVNDAKTNGNDDHRQMLVRRLSEGGTTVDVEQLAMALDRFLITDKDDESVVKKTEAFDFRDGRELESEESHVDDGGWEGWIETPKNATSNNAAMNDEQLFDDDGFSFPVNFNGCDGGESNGGEVNDVFFPSTFGSDYNDDQHPVAAASPQQAVENATNNGMPNKKTNKLTVATSFNASATVEYHKKQPKIKICIDGAPEFNPVKNIGEDMFFIAQPSPKCGDDACLLGGQTSSMPPSPAVSDTISTSKETVKGVTGGNRNKMPNLVGLLLSNALHKHDTTKAEKVGNHSPSAAGLLLAPSNEEGLEMDENDTSSNDLGNNVAEGHFFVSPATTTMNKEEEEEAVPSGFGFNSAKKTRKLLRRFKNAPLVGRKKSAFGSLDDDPMPFCNDT